MSGCCGTVPLSFTEEIRTLEGVSVAENANVKGLDSKFVMLGISCATENCTF